ncbi:MAG: phage tail family protein [Bacilli bacterium]|nr:phage tail family protein [Bacilli bacterium]
MRNYVIINGVNSTTKTGLAINEMPPITKPSIRTNTEEIDGRDGDIVTRLGYSAYDKEMTIGLYGSYDLDEIMSYFNQSGTIIFSTETDKYYNFEILEQIDFEKLARFKTATVTFHCQPFKYEVNETPITLISGDNVVRNKGNIYSKPIMHIEGTGTITISLGGNQVFNIVMGDNTEIEIDIEKLEAYNPNDGTLLNRIVTGDYDDFKLEVGNNTINLSGTITDAYITMYSRWL